MNIVNRNIREGVKSSCGMAGYTNCADFELRYSGYRIKGIVGQEINRHFPEMEWNKNSPFCKRELPGHP